MSPAGRAKHRKIGRVQGITEWSGIEKDRKGVVHSKVTRIENIQKSR